MRDPLKFNTTGCLILPVTLFTALMISTAGVAIWPQVAAPGAAIVCGGGEVIYESYGASYRPGEYTVTREIYCQTGAGKDAAREEITFRAIGVSFLVYALALFLLIRFVLWPLGLRRFQRKAAALGLGTPVVPAGFTDVLARVQEATQRGETGAEVRDDAADSGAGGGDIAARLAQLKVLRDQGLITAADYEAKKAEILAGL
jgi:hypothetical protein